MQTVNIKFFYSKLHKQNEVDTIKNTILSFLSNYFKISDEQSNVTIISVLTGGVEQDVIKFLSETELIPVIIVYHNSANSLPAVLEITTYLKELNRKVIPIHYENTRLLNKIVSVSSAVNSLKNSNIGIIGTPSDWLIASTVSEDYFNKTIKKLVTIQLSEIFQLFEQTDIKDTEKVYEKFSRFESYVDKTELLKSLKMYVVLKKIIEKYNLNCFSIRCFDVLEKYRTTSCLALSLLNSEGIISGCEGDMQSLMTMYITKLLIGKIPFMANPSAADFIENKLTLAHCTCAIELLNHKLLKINTHFESNLGTAVQGSLKQGIYTLVKFGGKNMHRSFISRARTIEHEWSGKLCRTQTVLSIDEDLKKYISNPIGNHMVLLEDDCTDILKLWYELFIDTI